MDKKAKLKQAIDLYQAKKQGTESFVLLKRIDEIAEKVEAIKIPDNQDIRQELQKVRQELEKDLVIELDIV